MTPTAEQPVAGDGTDVRPGDSCYEPCKFSLFSGLFLAIIEHMFAFVPEPVTLAQLAARRRELDAFEAEWLAMVASYDRSGQAHIDGYLGAAAALRDACHLDPGVAGGHVKLARKLEALPVTMAAFGDGEISRRHAQVIANAYAHERAAAVAEVEPILVQSAKHLPAKELHRVVRYATDALDGDDGASADAADHAQRALHISKTIGGLALLDGRLAADQAETVLTAINAEMERDRHPNETPAPPRNSAPTPSSPSADGHSTTATSGAPATSGPISPSSPISNASTDRRNSSPTPASKPRMSAGSPKPPSTASPATAM